MLHTILQHISHGNDEDDNKKNPQRKPTKNKTNKKTNKKPRFRSI